MPARYDTVSFLSDYGLDDEFVGVVKAVIRGIAPHVTVIDISHGVPPHDVRAGGLTRARSVQYLPPGVVLAVVDPGVGSDRRAVAIETAEAVFIGPDNGLLASAVALAGGAVRAHLCAGVELDELGEPVDPATLLPGTLPLSRLEQGRVVGEVLWVDRFGNVQLNVDPDELAAMGERISLRYGDQVRTAVRVHDYAQLGPGQIGLVVDSYGLIAVSLDKRSAADELRLHAPAEVTLEPAPER
jgi:S-adenosylmethionine hydrolase